MAVIHDDYVDIRSGLSPSLKERDIQFTWALLLRFRALLNDYFGSLLHEFLPTDNTCREWQSYMMDLQQAIECVVNQLTNCEVETLKKQGQSSKGPSLANIVMQCDRTVTEAIKLFDESSETDSGDKIANNIDLLQKLEYYLDREISTDRISKLSDALLAFPLRYANEAKKEYETYLCGLKDYLNGTAPRTIACFSQRKDLPKEDKPETEQDFSCTISRLVFLKASFFAFMAPKDWINGSRIRELINVQEQVRNEKLQRPSPHRFNLGDRISMIKHSKLLNGRFHDLLSNCLQSERTQDVELCKQNSLTTNSSRVRLFLCHSGEQSAQLCNDIQSHFQGAYDWEKISIEEPEKGIDSLDRLIETTQSYQAILVILIDEKNNVPKLQRFSRISSFCKIIQALDGGKNPSGFVRGIVNEIESRVEIQKNALTDTRFDSIQFDDEKMPYETIAEHLANACRKQLIRRISRNLVEENARSVPAQITKNSRLLQALVGRLQPPIMGTPSSGKTDVIACLKIAWDAYLYPKVEKPPIAEGPRFNLKNATWESLFTLFYATFVYSDSRKLKVKIEDANRIVISFEPAESYPDQKSQLSESVAKSGDFDTKAFDQLFNSGETTHKFFQLSKDQNSNVITILLNDSAI